MQAVAPQLKKPGHLRRFIDGEIDKAVARKEEKLGDQFEYIGDRENSVTIDIPLKMPWTSWTHLVELLFYADHRFLGHQET